MLIVSSFGFTRLVVVGEDDPIFEVDFVKGFQKFFTVHCFYISLMRKYNAK
jgi:hypothetical protein